MTPRYTEVIASDEVSRFDGYAAELRAMQKARTRGGSVPHGLHAKAHVGVVGSLVVPELPAHLRVGVFREPRAWPVYARFSNGSPRRQHDSAPDVRGLAIKLVGVPGAKVIKGLEDKQTQDFLLIPTAAIPFRDPDEFVAFVRISAKGGPPMLVARLLGHFGIGRGLQVLRRLAATPKVTSMVHTRFFTAAPIRFGDTAAKISLVPLSAPSINPAGASASDGKHALREDLVHRLKHGRIDYSLRVQLFIDEATTPIEDASVVWPEAKAPFVEVARLTFPQQDVTTARGTEIEELVERLSFDPWHAIEDHRPLGSVMRARAHAYRDAVVERQAMAEPDDVLSL